MRAFTVCRKAVCAAAVIVATAGAANVTMNFDSTGQVVDGFGGFGAMNVWWGGGPFYNDNFLSLVFENIGMTMIRTEFYPRPEQEGNFTKQIPYLQAIKSYCDTRNIELKVIATVWTPPARFKTNNNTAGGSLLPGSVNAYASYLVDYIKYFKQQTGYDLYAISPANEPQAEHYFNSCAYEEALLADVVKALAHAIIDEGLPTKVFYSDDLKMQHLYHVNVWNGVKTDAIANERASIHCAHYGDGNQANFAPYGGIAATTGGKAWNTEFGNGPDSWDMMWTNAEASYQMLRFGYSAIVYWLIGPHSNSSQSNESVCYDLQMGPKSYGAKAIFRYLRPGAVRVGGSSDDGDLKAITFHHPEDKTVTVLMWNYASSSKTVTLPTTQGLPTQWDVYSTGNGHNCEKTGTVAPGGTVTVPSHHIVTLYNSSSYPSNIVSVATAPINRTRTIAREMSGPTHMVTPTGRKVTGGGGRTIAPGVYLVTPESGSMSGMAAREVMNVR